MPVNTQQLNMNQNTAKLRVRLKLCGNCNPYIHLQRLLGPLKEESPEWEFVSSEESYDVLLVIHSCPAACASYDRSFPTILSSCVLDFRGTTYESEEALAKALREALETLAKERK